MEDHSLAAVVRAYLERAVNRRDITAVDDVVSPGYRGSGPGWPTDLSSLRRFSEEQYRNRADWHIEVEQTVELGTSVAVCASAGGTMLVGGPIGGAAHQVAGALPIERRTDHRDQPSRSCRTAALMRARPQVAMGNSHPPGRERTGVTLGPWSGYSAYGWAALGMRTPLRRPGVRRRAQAR